MPRPSITFIMPAFNAGSTIRESALSILDGNFRTGDELVVVDDGSTDDTAAVLRSLSGSNGSMKVIRHERNMGGGAARNTAVEAASNDLVFCLDSDNLLVPGSVDRLAQFLMRENADAAAFRECRFFRNARTEPTHVWTFRSGQTRLSDYLAGAVVPGASGNYLFKRDSWHSARKYPEQSFLDTWGFGLRQVAYGQRMMVMDDGHYDHRYGHDSYWTREHRRGTTSLSALHLLLPFVDRLEQRSIAYIMSWYARYDWFDLLDRHPLRVKGEPFGSAGVVRKPDGTVIPPMRRSMLKRISLNAKRRRSLAAVR